MVIRVFEDRHDSRRHGRIPHPGQEGNILFLKIYNTGCFFARRRFLWSKGIHLPEREVSQITPGGGLEGYFVVMKLSGGRRTGMPESADSPAKFIRLVAFCGSLYLFLRIGVALFF